MTTERRDKNRARMLKRGRIVFRGGHSAIDCVVLDLSPTGAKLKLSQLVQVPETFDLVVDDGPPHRVEVRYRRMDATGVRFLGSLAG